MKSKYPRIIIPLLAVSILLSLMTSGCGQQKKITTDSKNETSKTRTVTDLSGRKVKIPAKITKVAAFGGPSYEKTIMLGQVNKIGITMSVSSKWAAKVCPAIKNVPSTANFADPNIEELMSKKIDAVLFWDTAEPLKKMTDSNIPVIVTQQSVNNPDSVEAFKKYIKKEVTLFGNVFGGSAVKKAAEWCTYFDKKVKYVTSRTKNLTGAEIPKVYYVRGPSALSTHGRNSYTEWYIEMAGGSLVTKDSKTEMMAQANMEDIIKWNPDYIFMGRVDNTKLILNDPKWSNIKAVKDNKVFVSPDGVGVWDYGSEGVLLMEYFAKTLHPDLFKDLDMTKEVKEYYKKFYNYKLTDDDANRILQHLPPQ